MSEDWKDIKDAPKDGTEILAWCETKKRKGYEIIKWHKSDCWCDIYEDWAWFESSILGWMLLPKPPRKEHLCKKGLFECKENHNEPGLIVVDCQIL